MFPLSLKSKLLRCCYFPKDPRYAWACKREVERGGEVERDREGGRQGQTETEKETGINTETDR